MTSLKQIEANRRNALHSTGPKSAEGKLQSRANAYRHGLTAETIIIGLEEAHDYEAFELAITSEYEAETAVARQLVLRLASLLWRLRRASAFEAALFEMMAAQRRTNDIGPDAGISTAAGCFLKLMEHPSNALNQLSRYEHALWRQARQLIESLRSLQSHSRESWRKGWPAFGPR